MTLQISEESKTVDWTWQQKTKIEKKEKRKKRSDITGLQDLYFFSTKHSPTEMIMICSPTRYSEGYERHENLGHRSVKKVPTVERIEVTFDPY